MLLLALEPSMSLTGFCVSWWEFPAWGPRSLPLGCSSSVLACPVLQLPSAGCVRRLANAMTGTVISRLTVTGQQQMLLRRGVYRPHSM